MHEEVYRKAQALTERALAGGITFDQAIEIARELALSMPVDPEYIPEPGFFVARAEGPLLEGQPEPEQIDPLYEWRGRGSANRHEG